MSRLTGVVVLIGAVLAWLVATVATAQSTDWPVWAILPLTLLFGALVGAVSLAIAATPKRSWRSALGRGAVGVLVGIVVGELAAMALFSGAMPSAAQAQADVQEAHTAQTALDHAVGEARIRRDQALVVARCEYNPSPACPQTRITGVPGVGPESRTANDSLADAQRELDNAVAARESHRTEVTNAEQALQHARNTDRGLGARWVAMHQHTFTGAAAMALWAVTVAFFALLSVLPLILKLLRGETARHRAEDDADTAICLKRAEVRAEIENMWADQQLASARLAVDAQIEIDRVMQRRRVAEAFEEPIRVTAEPVEEDMYLPIEAEAKAATQTTLPARVESEGKRPLLQTATRWIRPLVPPIVARAIDTTTHPLRSARQVFEEVEEITFSFKRTYKATVGSEESVEGTQQEHAKPRVASTRRAGVTSADGQAELLHWEEMRQLRGAKGRELPPGE